jgi:hypothetical protein
MINWDSGDDIDFRLLRKLTVSVLSPRIEA